MRYAVTGRKAVIWLLVALLAPSGTCVAPQPVLTDQRMNQIVEYERNSAEHYARWDAELQRAEQEIREYLTPRACELLKQSPLSHEWLMPNPLLNGEIPDGLYRPWENARIIDRSVVDTDNLLPMLMHETGHALDDMGLVDRAAFEAGYMKLKDDGMRKGIEQHLDRNYNVNLVDRTGERIGYTFGWGYSGKHEIPDELKKSLDRALDVQKFEARKDVVFAGLRH